MAPRGARGCQPIVIFETGLMARPGRYVPAAKKVPHLHGRKPPLECDPSIGEEHVVVRRVVTRAVEVRRASKSVRYAV